MDFNLSEEQRLIQESIGRLLADRYRFEQRRKHLAEPEGWSRELWAAYAELGLLGLPFGEEQGGLGGGPIEVMLLMEAFGRALALEPYLATVILGGGVLRVAGTGQQQELLRQIANGNLTLAVASAEPQSPYDLTDVATTARRVGDSWILDGQKSVVLHGGSADRVIIPARVSGERRDPQGVGLFMLDGDAQGLSRRSYRTQDGLQAADLSLQAVRADDSGLVGTPDQGLTILARVVDEAIAALCAEAVGAMARLHEMTLEYLKTREQFGTPIGKFQALQHRAVDMFIALEQARSMAEYAAMSVSQESPIERRKAISAAKAQVGRSARQVGQEAIQLHGALGMTLDYPVGHYFKRLTMIDLAFGDSHYHVSELASGGGLISA